MPAANSRPCQRSQAMLWRDFMELTSQVKAAIQANRDDIATTYATQLQTVKSALNRNEQQLMGARLAFDKAMQVKQAFMREKDRKTNDAMQALRDARRAKWQSKVADAMESFQVAGIDATHDEMLQKIQERTAVNEARMEMAMSNVDTQGMKIEEEAEKIRANELLKQFKQEMGMEAPSSAPEGQKTLGSREGVKS